MKSGSTFMNFGSGTTETMAIDEERDFLFLGQGPLGLKVNVKTFKILDIFFANYDLISVSLDVKKYV